MSTSDADETVRLGFTGVGKRGQSLLARCAEMDDVSIEAICDVQERHLDNVEESLVADGRPAPTRYQDHERMLAGEALDGVIIASSWRLHIPMAIQAMEAGAWAAMEVGPASSVEECWDLVKTSERTGQHCMLLENACFGRDRMAVLNMVRAGLLGELLHAQCGYLHDIRPELHGFRESRMAEREGMGYRTLHFLKRNADVYPTHGIGPIAKYMGVNRGNRFMSLTSTATKARGLERWAQRELDEDAPTAGQDWAIGDIVTSVLRCANGETIIINHDCSSPRPKSGMMMVQGTDGLWNNDQEGIHVEDRSPEHEWEPFEEYRDEFEHAVWAEYQDEGVRRGHGGTDYLVMRSFVQSIAQDVRPPVDVYDAAAWMAISPLSEESIERGSDSVTFPDFTNGRWLTDQPTFGATGDDAGEGVLDFNTLL